MEENNLIKLPEPGTFVDGQTDVLRNGARKLLSQAVDAEVAEFLGGYSGLSPRKAVKRSFATGICPSARS